MRVSQARVVAPSIEYSEARTFGEVERDEDAQPDGLRLARLELALPLGCDTLLLLGTILLGL